MLLDLVVGEMGGGSMRWMRSSLVLQSLGAKRASVTETAFPRGEGTACPIKTSGRTESQPMCNQIQPTKQTNKQPTDDRLRVQKKKHKLTAEPSDAFRVKKEGRTRNRRRQRTKSSSQQQVSAKQRKRNPNSYLSRSDKRDWQPTSR